MSLGLINLFEIIICMKYTLSPSTFFVKELFKPKLAADGIYYYYILTKKGISDSEARKRIPTDALFCGKKDKEATTTQWFCTKYKIDDINEENFKVEFKGVSNEKIFIGAHKANYFRVKVELSEKEVKKLKKTNFKKILITNYFGEQRFDKRINEFNGLIEKEDYEGALKFFLTKESEFDSEKSTKIKKEIFSNWNKWKKLIDSEIIPESKKDIFRSLEKGNDFLKAFEFTEKKSLITMLKANQSLKWNNLLHSLIIEKVIHNLDGLVASKNIKPKLIVETNNFEKKITPKLTKLERNTYFSINKLNIKKASEKDNYFIEFTLSKGEYATIFLKFLEKFLK